MNPQASHEPRREHGEPKARRRSSDGGLRQLFKNNLRSVHWSALETGALSPGLPDFEGCYNGAQFFVEGKTTWGYAVKIRPLQVAWLHRRARAGGRCYVAVRRQHGGSIKRPTCDELLLYDGAQAGALAQAGTNKVAPLLVEGGGPSNWDWQRVLERVCAKV